jgi:hypothetical protein
VQLIWLKVEAEPEPVVPLYERWNKVALPKEEEEKGQGMEFTLRKWDQDADEGRVEFGETVFNPVWKDVGKKKIERYKSEEEKKKKKKKKKKKQKERLMKIKGMENDS